MAVGSFKVRLLDAELSLRQDTSESPRLSAGSLSDSSGAERSESGSAEGLPSPPSALSAIGPPLDSPQRPGPAAAAVSPRPADSRTAAALSAAGASCLATLGSFSDCAGCAKQREQIGRLKGMLREASEVIRREQAIADRLRGELSELRPQPSLPRREQVPSPPPADRAPYGGLTRAEEELQRLRGECARLRRAAAEQQRRAETAVAERDSARAEATELRRRVADLRRRESPPPPAPQLPPPRPARPARKGPPSAHAAFASDTGGAAQRSGRRRRGRAPSSRTSGRQQRRAHSEPSRPRPDVVTHGPEAPPEQSSPETDVRSERLMRRIRRAFEPPPKETMGILVASMVKELRRMMRQRGVDVPLERHGTDRTGCCYTLGSKKLNLAVSDGHLVVRQGGGHLDFIEYLARYLDSAAARAGPVLASQRAVQWP
eukprot:TRINITY_DN20380_c1_g1_i1.p1 TRINITY_DN20380_c1_g1~~TRINITY_DN20380_c1_g1_i1.p1  ORF type:complete len:459 (+),score=89.43 TRINITY_DN20380_c1_g1_i1:83-1378(+)